MKFEECIGKKVRVNTNIIDEYTNTKKVVEGIYNGWDSIGTSNYIIVGGESYPEMCIENFGLVPERMLTRIEDNVVAEVEEPFVPAFTLQTDPIAMIDEAVDELGLDIDYNEKSTWKDKLWFNGGTWGKALGVIALVFIIALGNIALSSPVESKSIDTSYVPNYYTPALSDNGKNCSFTPDGLCCDGKRMYISEVGTIEKRFSCEV